MHEGRTRRLHKLAYCQRHGIEYDSIPKGIVVMHSCDTPDCYNPDHLSLGTQKQNMQDCKMKGRIGDRFGENNGRSKINLYIANEIREKSKSGVSYSKLANEYGVGKSTISRVVRNENWQ